MNDCLARWKMGRGGFIGEVSLFRLRHDDAYAAREGVRCVELSDLHVHPLRRGRGWSRTLLEAATGYAGKKGWDVFLRIVPYNGKTLCHKSLERLYRSFGFRRERLPAREFVLRHHKRG